MGWVSSPVPNCFGNKIFLGDREESGKDICKKKGSQTTQLVLYKKREIYPEKIKKNYQGKRENSLCGG